MKKIILLLVGILFVACNSNPEYESNLAVAKKWVQAFEDQNIDLWKEAVSEIFKASLLCMVWEW